MSSRPFKFITQSLQIKHVQIKLIKNTDITNDNILYILLDSDVTFSNKLMKVKVDSLKELSNLFHMYKIM